MKKIALIALVIVSGILSAQAQSAYKVHVKIKDTKDSMVFLAHYYGKPLPVIYKTDSARIDKHGVALLQSNDTAFTGGMYMLMMPDRATIYEFVLNKGDDITMTTTAGKPTDEVVFTNSPENDYFKAYTAYAKDYSKRQQEYAKQLKEAKTTADSAIVRKKATEDYKAGIAYRADFIKEHPNTFIAHIFGAMQTPQVPEGDHFLEDGKTKDSTFAFKYYKEHYWDNFNFRDDRLILTPLYDGKLEEYINKLTYPAPDSMEKEADMLLSKTKGTKDLFHYTLYWLTRNVETSKIMGMDEVFVYLVENYYMKGDAFWLKSDELAKYVDRAQKIAPNVIGNLAPEIKVQNIMTKEQVSLLDTKAKYTLLVFYASDCGHCQHEIPILDSAYNAILKSKGVKVLTIATKGDEKAITDFIKKDSITDWINTWDPEETGNKAGGWRDKYDVYSTPTIYLLDEKKIIRGKRVDASNIVTIIDNLERKERDKAEKKDKKGTGKAGS